MKKLMMLVSVVLMTATSAMALSWPGYWCQTRPDTACAISGGPGAWTCAQVRYTGCNNCNGGIWPYCTGAAICTATDWTGSSTTKGAICNCTVQGPARLVVSACA